MSEEADSVVRIAASVALGRGKLKITSPRPSFCSVDCHIIKRIIGAYPGRWTIL